MTEENEPLISKHSSGISILIRVDGLWKDANNHSRNGLFDKWNRDLDAIWRELARDLTDADYTTKKEEFDGFDKKLGESGNFKDTGSDDFKLPSKEDITARSKQYRTLNDKELFLKRLENKLGKGTTFDDGEDDDFE